MSLSTRYAVLATLAAVLSGSAAQAMEFAPAPAANVAVDRLPEPVALHGRFETGFEAPAGNDWPRVRFTSPSGRTTTVSAFPVPGGRRSTQRYLVRFSPDLKGVWTWSAHTGSGARPLLLAGGRFEVGEGDDRGPVRHGPEVHQLSFADGSVFVPLGENRINVYDPSWNFEKKSIESYIAYMARNGMNTLRVFMFNDCSGEKKGVQPGCLEPTLGHYDEETAVLFDRVFDAAEKSGVYVVLAPFALGFTPGDVWKGWEENPYSRAQGGPARSHLDFFTNAKARELTKQRLKYVAARWGYSTHLLAVDLLNEPEWDGKIPEAVWTPWAAEMSKAFRAVDAFGHLVTTGSVGLQWNEGGSSEAAWYANRLNDLVQWHLYGKEYYAVHDLFEGMVKKVRETWGNGKPVLLGEFAYGDEPKPLYDHTHVGIWSAVFSGAGVLAHSAPQFTVDCDELMTPERAHHFRVLADFLRQVKKPGLDPVQLEGTKGVKALVTGDAMQKALWVMAPREGYGDALAGAALTLPQQPKGHYRVTWKDDVTGKILGASELVSDGGALRLEIPPFVRHAAGLVDRVDSAEAL